MTNTNLSSTTPQGVSANAPLAGPLRVMATAFMVMACQGEAAGQESPLLEAVDQGRTLVADESYRVCLPSGRASTGFYRMRDQITDRQVRYATKSGVDWKAARGRNGLELDSMDLRLDAGYRLTLSAPRGGAGISLRGQF